MITGYHMSNTAAITYRHDNPSLLESQDNSKCGEDSNCHRKQGQEVGVQSKCLQDWVAEESTADPRAPADIDRSRIWQALRRQDMHTLASLVTVTIINVLMLVSHIMP